MFQVQLTKQPQSVELPYITVPITCQFAGVDQTSTLYFINGTTTSIEILGYSYDSWKNHTSKHFQSSISGALYIQVISLIPEGIQVILGDGYSYYDWEGIISIVSESNDWWRITSILSKVFIPLTFLFSFAIMIKHLLRGEDGKGWNKSKIFDILNSVLIIVSVIFITVTTCAAQVEIVANINANTVPFQNDLGGFYANYLGNVCVNPTYPTNSVGLCTCTDTDQNYQLDSPCLQDACNNGATSTCTSYLAQGCDCYHSVYQWQCTNCIYQVNDSCTVDANNLSSYSIQANEQWKDCQKYYAKPTTILNVNFYVLITSAVIIVILNFIQIIVRYDSPLFDLLLTVTSIVLAFIQFLLILIGTIFVSLNVSGDCVQNTVDDLPGCELTSSDVLSMESLATTYLQNAYQNLYASPIIFIVSAIPDLLSLFVCMGCYRWYRISRGYETIDDRRRDKLSFIIITVTIIIIGIFGILIFLAAAALFFTAYACNGADSTCEINSVVIDWFFVIGAVPGSIVSICFVCCCCIIVCACCKK